MERCIKMSSEIGSYVLLKILFKKKIDIHRDVATCMGVSFSMYNNIMNIHSLSLSHTPVLRGMTSIAYWESQWPSCDEFQDLATMPI